MFQGFLLSRLRELASFLRRHLEQVCDPWIAVEHNLVGRAGVHPDVMP